MFLPGDHRCAERAELQEEKPRGLVEEETSRFLHRTRTETFLLSLLCSIIKPSGRLLFRPAQLLTPADLCKVTETQKVRLPN